MNDEEINDAYAYQDYNEPLFSDENWDLIICESRDDYDA